MSRTEKSPIVAKFGGSSMSDAVSIAKVADIVNSDADRRFIVVSAPGVNRLHKRKITDLLGTASDIIDQGEVKQQSALDEFSQRFFLLGSDLGCNQVEEWIQEAQEGIFPGNIDWSLSRGEWLMAKIFASYLGATFIDAEEMIRLQAGRLDPLSFELIRERLGRESGTFVIPGFYGLERGNVRTFARGGSDVTGAVVARGVNARLYENWTDVNGVLAASPKTVKNPSTIEHITYEEMRELGVRGASVLQRDTILPLVEVGIPINVRNTFNSHHPGTVIKMERASPKEERVIGVAGESGFVSFNIQRYGMNDEIIGRRVLEPFWLRNISYEQSPSGRDNMSVVVSQDQLDGLETFITEDLQRELQPDKLWVERNLGILALVGQNINEHAAAVAGKAFTALDHASIQVKGYSFGGSRVSLVIVVDGDRVNDATRVAYDTFIRGC